MEKTYMEKGKQQEMRKNAFQKFSLKELKDENKV